MSTERARSWRSDAVSGPRAGFGGRAIGKSRRWNDVIPRHGGTSFDVCLISKGQLPQGDVLDLEYGLPLQISALDIHTVGVGGGSIARVDEPEPGRVGPESAGALPGPRGLRQGRHASTVNRRHVVLAASAKSVRRRLRNRSAAASSAIAAHIATPLDLSVEDEPTQSRTRNPSGRRGAACRSNGARSAGSLRSSCSAGPGLRCRFRSCVARYVAGHRPSVPRSNQPRQWAARSRTCNTTSSTRSTFGSARMCERRSRHPGGAGGRGTHHVEPESALIDSVDVVHQADILQGPDAYAPCPPRLRRPRRHVDHGGVRAGVRPPLRTLGSPGVPVSIANLRTTVVGHRQEIEIRPTVSEGRAAQGPPSLRSVYFDGSWIETPVYQRSSFSSGFTAEGPLVIEQQGSTTVVDPRCLCRVDDRGNLLVELGSEA